MRSYRIQKKLLLLDFRRNMIRQQHCCHNDDCCCCSYCYWKQPTTFWSELVDDLQFRMTFNVEFFLRWSRIISTPLSHEESEIETAHDLVTRHQGDISAAGNATGQDGTQRKQPQTVRHWVGPENAASAVSQLSAALHLECEVHLVVIRCGLRQVCGIAPLATVGFHWAAQQFSTVNSRNFQVGGYSCSRPRRRITAVNCQGNITEFRRPHHQRLLLN